MTTPDAFDGPSHARTGVNHLGKLDECLKTHVSAETADAFRRNAAELDQLPGELLRDLILVNVHGKTHLELVAEHRRELMRKQGLRVGQERAGIEASHEL